MRLFFLSLVFLVAACSDQALTIDQSLTPHNALPQEKLILDFLDAFNAADPRAMVSFCKEDIKWGYVSQNSHDLAGQGKDKLVEEMETYFQSTPGVRAEAENIIVTGESVAVVERVYWKPAGQTAEKTQSAITVYQISDNLIQSVWYYPAQP